MRSLDELAGVTLLGEPASSDATAWLRSALTSFADSVASFVPSHFPAYARIYHPFGDPAESTLRQPGARGWRGLAGREMRSAHDAAEFALNGVPNAQASVGSVPRVVIERLLGPLSSATTTPDECYFALWEGFGDSVVPPTVRPTLQLPHRRYHVFAGSVSAALTSYSCIPFGCRSANLWWPADHAWCVATEVDAAWTYVAGPRSCVDALLDHRTWTPPRPLLIHGGDEHASPTHRCN
jgi:hypothetical protein